MKHIKAIALCLAVFVLLGAATACTQQAPPTKEPESAEVLAPEICTVEPSSLLSVKQEHALIMTAEQATILQLTDIQFEDYLEKSCAFRAVRTMVEKTSPDLIVFTGDTLNDLSDEKMLCDFINFMDGFGIPWATVMGNHDYEADVSVERQCELYEQSQHCIFRKGNIARSNGNYYYNVKKDGETVFSLIFMDSGEEGFFAEHVTWYEQTLQQIQAENGGRSVPSLVFYHIPTVESALAAQLYENAPSIGSGELRESVCEQEHDVGFFDKVKELQSTKALIYGHDHVNNAFISYEGILLCYGLKTGENSYNDDDLQGGNLITLQKDGDFLIDRVYI